jgi:hypothetical protein
VTASPYLGAEAIEPLLGRKRSCSSTSSAGPRTLALGRSRG